MPLLNSGDRLGTFEIVGPLGAGGMGEVYRATDSNLKRAVALKVLRAPFAAEADRVARFQREAETLAALNHPHIAAIYGLERSNGTTALVMELVEGPTLAQRLAHGPLPVDEALAIAKQIAEALEAAHEQGVVHRDLKPANVKVKPDGGVKVLDFGLAKVLEIPTDSPGASQAATITSPANTHPGVILGTAAYMAPEQARGRPVDKRADIWAFGVMLFEMVSGRRPFEGEDVAETLAAIVKSDPEWSVLPPALGPPLLFVLRGCLQKNPTHRLRDMADVRFVLEDAFASSASGTTAGPMARGWRPGLAMLLAGALAALVIATAAWGIIAGRRDVQNGAVNRFELTFRPGQTGGQFAFSPNGRMIVYRSSGADSVFRLYRRAMDQFDATAIADTDNGSYPFFSPDGQWVGFVVRTTLKKVLLAGGAPATLATLPQEPRGASWGRSGFIVVGDGANGLLQVPEGGGNPTVLAEATQGHRIWYPQVLDGHDAVIFTDTSYTETRPTAGEAELKLFELNTGRRRTLLQGSAGLFIPTGHIVFVRGRTIWVVGFDPGRGELLGTPAPVVERIGAGSFTYVAASPTGSLAYMPEGAGMRQMVWVDRQEREEPVAAPPRGYTYPRLSPDGRRVALDVREGEIDIWIYDFDSRSSSRLTFDPAEDEYPVWSRNGQRIFFSSFRDGSWGVFSQAADGMGSIQRVGTGTRELDPLSLAKDERALVVATGGDLFLLTLDHAATVLPLLTEPSVEGNADISPDGRWMAYQSNQSGRPEVYVRPFPRVTDGRWQISNTGGTHPLWSRDGRELFYVGAAGIMSVPIRPGQSFVFGNADVVLKEASDKYWLSTVGRAYDATPDGRRFLMLKEDQQAAARLRIVQNWTEELKQRAPTR